MSNYAKIAQALKRPGIDVISWDTPVLDIDWGGPGIHVRVTSAFHLWHRWGSDGRHRDLTVLTVGKLIELGIPRPEWLREPNLGRKALMRSSTSSTTSRDPMPLHGSEREILAMVMLAVALADQQEMKRGRLRPSL
jgi:hypothetical protein